MLNVTNCEENANQNNSKISYPSQNNCYQKDEKNKVSEDVQEELMCTVGGNVN